MPAPSKETLAVALDALRVDAASWRTAAGDMQQAAATSRGLGLPPHAFSLIGDQMGLAASYDKLQFKLATLGDQAVDYFIELAAALEKAAQDYQADDDANAHAIRNVW